MRQSIFTRKYFSVVVFVITSLCILISVYSLFQAVKWIGKPFPGFLLYRNLTVAEVSLSNWTGRKEGLVSYDKIVDVERKKVSSSDEVYSIVAKEQIDTPLKYTVSRGDKIITVRTMEFKLRDFFLVFGVVYFVGVVFFITGILVFYLKPNLSSSRVFLISCLSIGFWFTSIFDTHSTYSLHTTPFLGLLFTPACLIHLAFVFPVKRENSWVALFAYFLSSLLFTLNLVYFDHPHIWARIEIVFWLYVALGTLVFVVSTLMTYLRSNFTLDKQRAQIILLGSCVGFFLPGLSAAAIVLSGSSNLNILALSVAFFPLSVAYAIIKHKLFDIDEIVKKTLVYGALTGIVGGVFALLIAAASNAAFDSLGDWTNPAVLIVLSIFLVVVLNPVKARIQDLVDSTFFRKRYDYRRTVEETSYVMTSLLNLDDITYKIIGTIEQTMFAHPICVILYDRSSEDYRVYNTSKSLRVIERIDFKGNNTLVELLNGYRQEIFKEDLAADERYMKYQNKLTGIFNEFSAALFIPVFFKGQLIGILSLGEKKSGLPYNSDDIKLLRILANQSAIAIENAFAFNLVENYARKLEQANKELQEAQTQLIRAEKMSAIGQLAAGIAHEIRNPLNIIEGARYYLTQVTSEGNSEVLREYLGYIKHQVERTNRLIDSLLKFSRMEPTQFELVNVNKLFEETLILMKKQFSDGKITLVKNFDYGLPDIMGDPNQLWQVFINILLNAIQAMPQGGELRISTGLSDESGHIFVSFMDTGVGIDKEDLPKIFDPFFTKKHSGTGLGLSVSYRIVQDHNGEIMVSSEKGRGTTFVVELPTIQNQKGGADGREQKSLNS